MMRIVLAAAAALALWGAAPAYAGGCPDCKDCPMQKTAAAGAAEQKGADAKPVACPCGADAKECKCGAKCECPHCAAKKAAEKDGAKKS